MTAAGTDFSSGFLSSQGVRASGWRQRGRIAGSFALHVSVVFALFVPPIPAPPDPPKPPVVRLVPITDFPKPKPKPMPKAVREEPPPAKIRSPIDKSKVDASAATFEVHYPPAHLLDIIQSFGATLGFGPADRPTYITARFRPGDWSPVHLGQERRDDFVAFRIQQHYPLFDDLQRRYHLENCVAWVLFPEEFRDRITAALQEQAALSGLPGQVLSAKVMLSYNPAGVHVEALKMGGEAGSQN
jgi:hypothetical protein